MSAHVLLNLLNELGEKRLCRASYRFSPTILINSIIQEHECEILLNIRHYTIYRMWYLLWVYTRATEILKSTSVCPTDDVIDVIQTCVRQSQIVTKTNDSLFSSKSVSEIDYFSNTL